MANGDRIAELLLQQGSIRAQGLRESGRIWGNLAEQLGQIPAQTYGAYVQQRKDKQQTEMQALQATNTKSEITARDVTTREHEAKLKKEEQAAADLQAIAEMQQHFPKTPEGAPDYDAFMQQVWLKAPQSAPEYQKQVDATREANQKLEVGAAQIRAANATAQEKQLQIADLHADHLGALAATVMAAKPEERAHTLGIQLLTAKSAADKLGLPFDATPVTNAIASGRTVDEVMAGVIQASTKQRGIGIQEANAAATRANTAADNTRLDLGAAETARHNRAMEARPVGGASAGQPTDIKESIAGMKDGTLPPQLPGRASKDYTAIMAEAHRQGFDLVAAVQDWTATQKHIASLNSNQQLRLNQSINQLPELLDTVETLARKWKGGRFPVLNRVNLAAAKGGAYGEDVASVARQLDAQIADVTADLGNVYMGGNSPTDHALALAAKSLSGDWSEKVLTDMVTLARKNVQTRQNSIRTTGVAGASPTNIYDNTAPPASAAPASAPLRREVPGHPGTFAVSADGGKTWKVE